MALPAPNAANTPPASRVFGMNAEISQILKTWLYLAEGAAMPQAFYKYLKHSLQERAQSALWRGHQIDTSFVPGGPYPNEL